MQNEPDSDHYVKIWTENIKFKKLGRFDIHNESNLSNQYYPCDFEITIHYSAMARSKNGRPTILIAEVNMSI